MLQQIDSIEQVQRTKNDSLQSYPFPAETCYVRNLRLETPIDGNFDKRRRTVIQRPRSYPKDTSIEIDSRKNRRDERQAVSNR